MHTGGVMTHRVEVPDYRVQDSVRVDASRAVLLIGDMQNDFVTEGGTLVVPHAEETVPAIRKLLDLARDSGMRVVFVQDTHNEGDPEWEIWGEHCREGSWGWQVVDGLAPNEDEVTIRKPRYDAFYGTDLEHLLRLWNVDTVIICGTVANICVHYTASSAAMRWFNVVVPRDCISSFNDFDMEASLSQTATLLGEVADSENIRIGTPETEEVYMSKLEEAAARERGDR
jgi:nicotinamidase-related amidase